MCKKLIEIQLVNCDRKPETFTQHELIENSKSNQCEWEQMHWWQHTRHRRSTSLQLKLTHEEVKRKRQKEWEIEQERMQMSGRTAELSFNGKRTFEFTMEPFYILDKWKINAIKFCVIMAIVQMTEYVFFPSLHNSSGWLPHQEVRRK